MIAFAVALYLAGMASMIFIISRWGLKAAALCFAGEVAVVLIAQGVWLVVT